MKKRMVSMLLVLVMLVAALPVTALAAAAEDIAVYAPTYNSTGTEVSSLSTSFDWTSASVSGRLILCSKELRGGKGSGIYIGGTYYTYGDFTNFGYYASQFDSYSEAKAYDVETGNLGFIAANDSDVRIGDDNPEKMTFDIPAGTIPLNVDATYYLYLWVQYGSEYYPDNLICVIKVENGILKYTSATSKSNSERNCYDASKFVEVPVDEDGEHTCKPSTGYQYDEDYHWVRRCDDSTCVNYNVKFNMARHSFTSEQDTDCDCGYERVVHNHTTEDKYDTEKHWKETVCNVAGCQENGKISDEGSHQYADDQDTTCDCGYVRVIHKHTSSYKWDTANHWMVTVCNVSDCQMNGTISNKENHKFENAQDTTCDCGYVRPAPAEKPNTGDITNIPLWTMLVCVGAAAMYLQLTQRKRETF